MNRWQAAGIHLLISAVVVGTLAFALVEMWYPFGLFQFAKADKLLLIVTTVDIAAGPLLTLIVYKRNKPSLKMDLTLIGIVQAGLLAYGLSTVWLSRPVFIVALPERLVLVFANEINDGDLPATGKIAVESLPWFGPKLVGARAPDDPEVKQRLIDEMLAGTDLPQIPQYYVPYSDIASELLASSDPVNNIGAYVPESERALATRELGARYQDTGRVVPITSSRNRALAVIDQVSAEPIYVWLAPATGRSN